MAQMDHISQASALIAAVHGHPLSIQERSKKSIELAALILQDALAIQTSAEKQLQTQLSRMMEDPNGKLFVTSMTDQCFRSHNPERVANQLVYLLNEYGVPNFLPFFKRLPLALFRLFGNVFPKLLVPIAKRMIQKETETVILPGETEELQKHIEKRRAEGVRINLNHLGEAILGENEAEHRLNIYLNDLAKPEIEYISVKISTIYSQINQLAWKDTLSHICERLKKLYRCAQKHRFILSDGSAVPKFVNLDMEEYRDLNLTVDAFCNTLDDPEFFNHSAGIVLQCYLPDSYKIQQKLTEWAMKRVSQGGAPIKIRIVKGANLAMEKVEAAIRGWPQAPYETKSEVDANFKRMLLFGFDPKHASVAHLGVGSHNLFDIAFALLLRSENKVGPYVCFEMLEGMADHMRRVIQRLSGDMLLYCPAATKEEFQNAVAYLVRRLDENTAPENFLRFAFDMKVGSKNWNEQVNLFTDACEEVKRISDQPRRTQNRTTEIAKLTSDAEFCNEPDTDWSLPANRLWAEKLLQNWSKLSHPFIPLVIGGESILTKETPGVGEDPSSPGKVLYQFSLANETHLDQALQSASKSIVHASKVEDRSKLLAKIAQGLRSKREELIGAMVADTGKVISEADVEVSEAIDFAEYYRKNIEELATLEDIKWQPKGIALVAPPWNFPCSIPAGGILASLAAGNSVIFKPAKESVLVGWHLAQIFWEAGVDKNVLQFITCEDEPIGSKLVQDPRIACVVLTGATATAKHLLKIRPGLDLIAETGGKNTLIITNMADRDLAIKDLVQSAFGHAGQKCSACSLAICESEVYDDPHFRKQLLDAVSSWHVGSQWDLKTRLNPLIHEPNSTLLRGLTTLEPGEEWLLKPKQDVQNPNLWSPGIKLGVTPSSFTYQNELFGPVLGIMRADNLEHALDLANGTPYGLTAGLHSLDKREHDYWLKHIVAGNLYINRGITGAIVQRQPFGGCKESSFGPGAKAGGPNYVMQLMRPEQIAMPSHRSDEFPKEIHTLSQFASDLDIWNGSVGSYAFFWNHYFIHSHDPSKILGQDNLLSYVPHSELVLRVQSPDSLLDVVRVAAAMIICQGKLEISGINSQFLNDLRKIPSLNIVVESDENFIERVKVKKNKRVRFLSQPANKLVTALANMSCNVTVAPVIANGRIELMHFLRETSLSIDYHRYGYLGDREEETECTPQTCCGGRCC